jgi:hypothetical protein
MDDAILRQLSVPSLLLWIASESQSLLSSLSSEDDSLSLRPKIGLASKSQSLIPQTSLAG